MKAGEKVRLRTTSTGSSQEVLAPKGKVAVGTATATWTANIICTRPGEDGEANYRKEVPVRVFFWVQGGAELANLLPSLNKYWRRPDRVVFTE